MNTALYTIMNPSDQRGDVYQCTQCTQQEERGEEGGGEDQCHHHLAKIEEDEMNVITILLTVIDAAVVALREREYSSKADTQSSQVTTPV